MRVAALSLLFNSLFAAGALFATAVAQAAPLSVCSEASPEASTWCSTTR